MVESRGENVKRLMRFENRKKWWRVGGFVAVPKARAPLKVWGMPRFQGYNFSTESRDGSTNVEGAIGQETRDSLRSAKTMSVGGGIVVKQSRRCTATMEQ
jgi:hypothetical protein